MSYFKLSDSNSIIFARQNSSVNKNDLNSTSCQNLNNYKYKEVQLFNSSDIIKTQFRSGYSIIDVNIIDSNGIYTNIPITQKTANQGLTYSLDGRKYNYKDTGQLAIYFTTGVTYLYDTSTIEFFHELNGELPDYAIVGQEVEEYGGSMHEITGIVYDEDVDSNVILTNSSWSGADTAGVFQSLYDIQPYEVYEFQIDFSNYIGRHTIEIVNYSNDVGRTTLVSEEIFTQNSHKNTLEINYYNDDDNDILYSTGITHKLRVYYDKIVAVSDNENEYIVTDDSVKLLDSQIDDKNGFYFREVTTALMRKLKIALSSDNVFINDIGYVSDGTLNETPIENTNLYSLEAIMIKTDDTEYVEPTLDSDQAAWDFIERTELDGASTENRLCIILDYENDY